MLFWLNCFDKKQLLKDEGHKACRVSIIFYVLPLFLSGELAGQVVWSGKAPGKAGEWMEPRNWVQNRLPDIWDKVVLPYRTGQSGTAVVLRGTSIRIASLELQSGSRLEITKGTQLIIDGSDTYDYGILLLGGILTNDGEIIIVNAGLASIEKLNGLLINNGTIRVELSGDLLEQTGGGQVKRY